MSMVRLQLLVGWPTIRYQHTDVIETFESATDIHLRVKEMIDTYYQADASMESNLGMRSIVVRLDCTGEHNHYYDQVWRRMIKAAKGLAVA